jgi:hypothetical protein
VYGDGLCLPSCTVTSGTPIPIASFQAAENIDIALAAGNRISGTVSDINGPLVGVTVSAVNSSGATVRSAVTGAGGTYLISLLVSGTYFLRTANSLGYIDEAYDNLICLACNAATAGGPPTVFSASGELATNKNFVLDRGGQIAGRVSDAATGNGIGGITVQIFDRAGRLVGNSTTSSEQHHE